MASLSAVGAGALAITADKAEAGPLNIVYSGPMSAQVGWSGSGAHGSATFHLLGSLAKFEMLPSASNHPSSGSVIWRRRVNAYGASGLRFGLGAGSLLVVGPGATWAAVSAGAGGAHLVGGRFWQTYSSGRNAANGVFGHSPFGDKHLLFRTGAGNHGWVELSYDVTNGAGGSFSLGPSVMVEGYAYDNSGAIIAAGDTGATVPEPSTVVETGLAELVLGAAAWRRTKRKRASVTAVP